MSNFRKSFNFRNGVQVDTDDFIVRGSLVGIGTTIPTEQLDVRGTTKVVGLVTSQELHVVGVATIASSLDVGLNGEVTISNGIVTSRSGVVTYYGDGGKLLNLPTSQWVDVDPTFAYESIYAAGPVGVATTNPEYFFQVGGNPDTANGVGFNSTGDVNVSGVITASSFVGSGIGITQISASNIESGTILNDYLPIINNDRLPTNINKPTGIITASQFVGYLTGGVAGIATLARGLTGTPGVSVGLLTATQLDLNGGLEVSGVSTFSSNVIVNSDLTVNNSSFYVGSGGQSISVLSSGNVGIGTTIPSANLQISDTSGTSVEIISRDFDSYVSVGQSVGAGNSSAVFSYEGKTLKLTNYDTGGVNVTLHAGTGSGTTEGFKVRYDNTNVFNVTYDGRVSIGRETPDPEYGLHLQGSSYISGNQVVVGIITIGEGGNRVTFGDGSPFPIPQTQNFDTVTGISTFHKMNLLNTLSVGQTATFNSNVDILSGNVAIGTDQFVDTSKLYEYKLITDGGAFIREGLKLNSRLLLTDQTLDENNDIEFITDPRDIPNAEPYSSWVPFLDFGGLQVENKGVGYISQSVLIVPYGPVESEGYWGGGVDNVGIGTTLGLTFGGSYESTKYLSKVGINTFFPRAVLDVGTASTAMNSFILPPRVSNVELDIIRQRVDKYTPDGTPEGGFLYNLDNHRLEVGIGTTTFCGIVTLTNNHSGYYSLVTPIVDNSGRAGLAQTSIGAIVYNSSVGLHQGYGAAGWVDLTNSGVSLYSSVAGVSTYAESAGIATALNADSSVNTTGILTASILSTGDFGVGINIDGTAISGPALITIDPAAVGDDTGAVRIRGDLIVDGQQTILSSTVINFADQVIGIGTTAVGDSQLNGSGIGIGSDGYQKTLLWNNAAQSLRSSEHLDVASGKTYKINGTNVLSSNTLGSGVVNSSLTSVGTLTKLDVGNVDSTGIITASQFSGSFTGTVTGTASTANYALIAGIATNAIGGIVDVTRLNVSGISTVGFVTSGNIFSTGIVTATRFASNVAQGTAPISVASSTKVTNLNVDYLDDKDGAWYLDYNNFTNTPTIGNGTLTLAVSGNGLSGSQTFGANQTGNATFTVTSNADSANVNGAIVSRNGVGGFSAGIITSTEFKGPLTGNVTGNVSGNLSGNVNSSGISTFNTVVAGSATTALVVTGDTRITGILTIGTGSITLNGSNDIIRVGTGITINGSTGVITATTFNGTLTGFAATAGYAKTAIEASTSTFANASETANTANTATTLTASSNVNTSGIITATGGFSGAFGGSPVVITVSGSTLTFTVAGVGATSLTLYP